MYDQASYRKVEAMEKLLVKLSSLIMQYHAEMTNAVVILSERLELVEDKLSLSDGDDEDDVDFWKNQ